MGYKIQHLVDEPTGKKEITSTAETDVSTFAKAQVVDDNLVAENIAKDVNILGVTGTFNPIPVWGTITGTLSNQTDLQTALNAKEAADATIIKQANVVDNVTSTTTTAPLSANQGKNLNDRINNLESIGRFLSIWNCTTGLPITEPGTTPYTYKTGDYFRVGAVGTTNYKPDGTSYSGTASTVEETADVATNDVYFFDGITWTLQVNHVGAFVSDVQVDGTSVVSAGVANITGKENTSNKVTSFQATPDNIHYPSEKLVKDSLDTHANNSNIHVTTSEKSTWNAKQDAIPANTYDAYGSAAAVQTNLNTHTNNSDIHVTTSDKSTWNSKSTVSVAASGTATDEVQYITINGVEKKLAGGGGGGAAVWGSITGTLSNQTDLQTALNAKQNSLPTVVNDKFLHTNASTGALEWTEYDFVTNAEIDAMIDTSVIYNGEIR